MSQISIEGMEFFAYHGCFAEEQIIGTKFLVDLFLLFLALGGQLVLLTAVF